MADSFQMLDARNQKLAKQRQLMKEKEKNKHQHQVQTIRATDADVKVKPGYNERAPLMVAPAPADSSRSQYAYDGPHLYDLSASNEDSPRTQVEVIRLGSGSESGSGSGSRSSGGIQRLVSNETENFSSRNTSASVGEVAERSSDNEEERHPRKSREARKEIEINDEESASDEENAAVATSSHDAIDTISDHLDEETLECGTVQFKTNAKEQNGSESEIRARKFRNIFSRKHKRMQETSVEDPEIPVAPECGAKSNQQDGQGPPTGTASRLFALLPNPADDPSSFILRPAPQGLTVRCVLTRNNSKYPIFFLHMEREDGKRIFLMAARRRKKSKTSNYLISCDPTDMTRDAHSFAGKVRSNFMGTQFTIYDSGVNPKKLDGKLELDGKEVSRREEVAAVIYDTNVLGFKGPRKMTVIIPGMNAQQERVQVRPLGDAQSIMKCWLVGDMANLLELQNKSPVWNESTQSYVLNFNGRVTQASVKNFQIVHRNDVNYIVMQFGRVSSEKFTMDYAYPLCALQAFGIVLSSFDKKLACE